jgi:hypothetical protein
LSLEFGGDANTETDLSAHSNFVELCLLKMGHRDVFCYVGDNTHIRAPNGETVPPLVTGTFGSSDFIFSRMCSPVLRKYNLTRLAVLGEGSDKLSSSTVTTLQDKMSQAQNTDSSNLLSNVQGIMSKLPTSQAEQQSQAQKLQEIHDNAVNLDPDAVLPEQAQQYFKQALLIFDDINRTLDAILEQFPFVKEFMSDLRDALTLLVLSTVEPFIIPILGKVLDGISEGSEAILKSEDQLGVFNNPNESDPTHSVISKDRTSSPFCAPAA